MLLEKKIKQEDFTEVGGIRMKEIFYVIGYALLYSFKWVGTLFKPIKMFTDRFSKCMLKSLRTDEDTGIAVAFVLTIIFSTLIIFQVISFNVGCSLLLVSLVLMWVLSNGCMHIGYTIVGGVIGLFVSVCLNVLLMLGDSLINEKKEVLGVVMFDSTKVVNEGSEIYMVVDIEGKLENVRVKHSMCQKDGTKLSLTKVFESPYLHPQFSTLVLDCVKEDATKQERTEKAVKLMKEGE